MLSRIFIQNFALIDTLEINLNQGLQVITGETGAGKSIILGALRLLLGERVDLKNFSTSEKKSIVEAEFSINTSFMSFFEENDIEYESNTVIRREILPSGKTRAFINDVPVTLDILKSLSEQLIDIHSQFETSKLFTEEYQFKIIDGLSENKTLLIEYQQEYQNYTSLQRTISNLKNQLDEGKKESDYQNFLLSELNAISLDELNFEDLKLKLSTLENAENITENLSSVFSRFDAEEIGILDGLIDAKNKLNKVSTLSHEFSELNQRFEENFVELKDILFELQDKAEQIEINKELLEDLNGKINQINVLYNKHNVSSVEELIEIRNDISIKQDNFSSLEDTIKSTEKELNISYKKLDSLAEKLSYNRSFSRNIFIQSIESLLKQLGLEKAKIDIEISPKQKLDAFGKDDVNILFQANSGFPMKDIKSSISGGERSRIMLAIKKLMADNSDLPTLILDEIDTGVSGKVAEEIGNVMREMEKKHNSSL